MEEVAEEVLSGQEIIESINEAGEKQKISPFDPDFILILLFAIFVDIIDAILALFVFLDLFTISWGVSIIIDLFIFVIIGNWIYWRVGRIIKSKREQQETLKKAIAKRGESLEKQLARGIKSPFRRTLTRGGLAFLGEIAWLIGLIPFWTISVVLTLREK